MTSNQLSVASKDKRELIAELLTAVNNQYRVTWDEISLELAVNCLEYLEFDYLKAAIQLWMKESRWAPTVADINQYYALVQADGRRQEERKQEEEQDRELYEIKMTHRRAQKQWDELLQETKDDLLRRAIAHPLSAFLKPETVARNILLFGEVKAIEDKE